MADEELDEDNDVDGDGEDGESSSGGKKKLFIIIGLVVFLLIGGAAGAFFTGLLDPLLGVEEEVAKDGEGENAAEGEEGAAASPPYFLDLPDILVTLNTGGRKSTFLKIGISLELKGEVDAPKIQQIMPRIINSFQIYLRELRLDDLKGSAGIYRLNEELLKRVNAAATPTKINAVLFKEMLVHPSVNSDPYNPATRGFPL